MRPSYHLHKVGGPGGMMVAGEETIAVEPGKKYRVVLLISQTGTVAPLAGIRW